MLELRHYLTVDGRSPFAEWFAALDSEPADRVQRTLERMVAGNLSDTKAVGSGVLERRIDWGPGYRIYFGREGSVIVVLLSGGTK
jgi:putative addiction module killer protein